MQNPLFSLIDQTEGAGNYSTLFGHAQKAGNPFDNIDVSTMTLDELRQFSDPSGRYGNWVKQKLAESGHRPRIATPMGRHQIVGSTMNRAAEQMGLSGDTVFDANTQNAMAMHLASQRLSGQQSMAGKRAALRSEWEGFKNVDDADLNAAIEGFERGGYSTDIKNFASRQSRGSDAITNLIMGGSGGPMAQTQENPGMTMRGGGFQFDPATDMAPAPQSNEATGWQFDSGMDMPPVPQTNQATGWQFNPATDMPPSPMVGDAATKDDPTDDDYEEAGAVGDSVTGGDDPNETEEERRARRIAQGKLIYQFGVGLDQLFKGEEIDIGEAGVTYLEQYAPHLLDAEYTSGGTGGMAITPAIRSGLLEYDPTGRTLAAAQQLVAAGDDTGFRQMVMKIPELAADYRSHSQAVGLEGLRQEHDFDKLYLNRGFEVSDDLRDRDWSKADWQRDVKQGDVEWARQRNAQLDDMLVERQWSLDDDAKQQYIDDMEAQHFARAMELGGEQGQAYLAANNAAPSTQKGYADVAFDPSSQFHKAVKSYMAENPDASYDAAYKAMKQAGAAKFGDGVEEILLKDALAQRSAFLDSYRASAQSAQALNTQLAAMEEYNNSLFEKGRDTSIVSEPLQKALGVVQQIAGETLAADLASLLGVDKTAVEGMDPIAQSMAYAIARENKGQGSITEREREALLRQVPNLMQTKEGRKALIDRLKAFNAIEIKLEEEMGYVLDNMGKDTNVRSEERKIRAKYSDLAASTAASTARASTHSGYLSSANIKLRDDKDLTPEEERAILARDVITGDYVPEDDKEEDMLRDYWYKHTLIQMTEPQAAIAPDDLFIDGFYWDKRRGERRPQP